jgi:hypothetical protein
MTVELNVEERDAAEVVAVEKKEDPVVEGFLDIEVLFVVWIMEEV